MADSRFDNQPVGTLDEEEVAVTDEEEREHTAVLGKGGRILGLLGVGRTIPRW